MCFLCLFGFRLSCFCTAGGSRASFVVFFFLCPRRPSGFFSLRVSSRLLSCAALFFNLNFVTPWWRDKIKVEKCSLQRRADATTRATTRRQRGGKGSGLTTTLRKTNYETPHSRTEGCWILGCWSNNTLLFYGSNEDDPADHLVGASDDPGRHCALR